MICFTKVYSLSIFQAGAKKGLKTAKVREIVLLSVLPIQPHIQVCESQRHANGHCVCSYMHMALFEILKPCTKQDHLRLPMN